MIRIVLADDHMLFREGLRKIIEEWNGFEVVGEASDGAEAVIRAKALSPDIVLMDVDMPGMGGIEAVRRIKEEAPDVRCVMLTVSESEEGLRDAVEAGAAGYVLKDMPMKRFRSMLRGVMDGEAPISGRMAAKAIGMMHDGVDANDPQTSVSIEVDESLTPREVELLRLIAEGKSNQDIAAQLYVSEKTVKKHLNSIYTKLGITNRVQAAVYAIRSGLA